LEIRFDEVGFEDIEAVILLRDPMAKEEYVEALESEFRAVLRFEVERDKKTVLPLHEKGIIKRSEWGPRSFNRGWTVINHDFGLSF